MDVPPVGTTPGRGQANRRRALGGARSRVRRGRRRGLGEPDGHVRRAVLRLTERPARRAGRGGARAGVPPVGRLRPRRSRWHLVRQQAQVRIAPGGGCLHREPHAMAQAPPVQGPRGYRRPARVQIIRLRRRVRLVHGARSGQGRRAGADAVGHARRGRQQNREGTGGGPSADLPARGRSGRRRERDPGVRRGDVHGRARADEGRDRVCVRGEEGRHGCHRRRRVETRRAAPSRRRALVGRVGGGRFRRGGASGGWGRGDRRAGAVRRAGGDRQRVPPRGDIHRAEAAGGFKVGERDSRAAVPDPSVVRARVHPHARRGD
mmetsp:Transcript_6374/g.26429  ORF Transcript_6374/g.26429 Transcript_6374/m.26429 type:complete len:320 (+) Transcript_6374:302-1261(+)